MRRWGWLVWAVPGLATLGVGLVGVGHAQPWRDELATWSAATRPLGDLLRLTRTIDAATGPYYLLLHGWTRIAGDSVTALRLPSTLAMAGAAALTAVLGRRLYGARAGLLAGLLFALLPGTSRYAQEARPYAIATLFAVLATLLLVRAVDRPVPARWAGYAAAVVGLGLAHLLGLVLLAGHAVVLLVAGRRGRHAAGLDLPRPVPPRHDPPPAPPTGPGHPPPPPDGPTATPGGSAATPGGRGRVSEAPGGPGTAGGRSGWRPLWGWVVAVAVAVVLLAPLLLTARGQRSRQLDWVDPARLGDLAALPRAITLSGVVGGLLVGLAALGAGLVGRRALLPVACLSLPVLLVFAAGAVVPLWVPRYLLFVVPFGCLLGGAGLALVPAPAALAVLALTGLLGLPDQRAVRREHGSPVVDYRGAARIVAEGRQPGDAVVYSPRDGWQFLDLGTAYHLGDRRPRDVLVVRDQRQRADLWVTECPRPAECLAGTRRVWLVVAGRRDDPLAAVPGGKGDALRDGFTVERVWPRAGVTVALLARSPG